VLKPHLKLIPTEGMSREEWKKYQLKSIGGSSSGAILGLNPYMSALELFHLYIGEIPQKDEDNAAMYFGRKLEPIIIDTWKYWDGAKNSFIENEEKGKIIQESISVPAIIYNPDYPHLHANIDNYIIKHRDYGKRPGILEAKSISSMSAKKWEAGFPPTYVIQVHEYMLVTETDISDIVILKDGRDYEAIPIHRDERIIEVVKRTTKEFWEKVTEAIKIRDSDLPEDQKKYRIALLEPPVEDTPAYEAYLKERYRKSSPSRKPILADLEHFEWVKGYLTAKKDKDDAEAKMRLFQNRFKRLMEDTEIVDFGAAGKVSWKSNVNGVRKFDINVKLIDAI
jgi:putative phage-type endonuclease